MKIRSAEISDYEAVASIRDSLVLDVARLDDPAYADTVEQSGFLMPVEISRPDFIEQVSNYIVGEIDDTVVGFLRLDGEQEMDPNEVPRWLDPAMEAIYWSMPHANIGKIAVLPDAGRQGIASGMLAEAERRTRGKGIKHLFSFIVSSKPPTNYPSIRFHTKHGFHKVAPIELQLAYGISDYLVTLYGKEL